MPPSTADLAPAQDSRNHPWRRMLTLWWPTAWAAALSWTPVACVRTRGGVRGWIGAISVSVGIIAMVICITLLFDTVRHRGASIPQQVRGRAQWLFVVGAMAMVITFFTCGKWGLQIVGFEACALGLALPWQRSVPINLIGAAALYLEGGWPLTVDAHNRWSVPVGVVAAGLGSALGRFSAERDVTAKAMAQHARQLEISEERNRMARDLHDILGHTLTVIAMKTELAEMLLDADPDRARGELREVQSLTRSALADVRATVNNYRELSLAGELARAGSTLRTAGVRASLPAAVDEVDPQLRELFAWALRESVTNIARHAAASECVVTLTPTSIRIDDDGVGEPNSTPTIPDGQGLTGLRQRAQAFNARVERLASPLGTRERPGFSLLVSVEPPDPQQMDASASRNGARR